MESVDEDNLWLKGFSRGGTGEARATQGKKDLCDGKKKTCFAGRKRRVAGKRRGAFLKPRLRAAAAQGRAVGKMATPTFQRGVLY